MALAGKRLGVLAIGLGLASSGASLSNLELGRLSLPDTFLSLGGGLE
ncbi:hypothetical protein [Candidatus Mycoplasma haematominutum]|nr:hypothetical protein [Candidatus Mycoplasma haematominutum]